MFYTKKNNKITQNYKENNQRLENEFISFFFIDFFSILGYNM